MVFVQDGMPFFSILRMHIACVIMEQRLALEVEPVVFWITSELMETIYLLQVDKHARNMDNEKIFYEVQTRWPAMESVFYTVFRVPSATWSDFHIELEIDGRDLFLSEYKEPMYA